MGEKHNIALITGASSGLGREFAFGLADLGYDLILTARNMDRLSEIRRSIRKKHPDQSVEICTADLTRRQEIQKLEDWLADRDYQIVINNAGFGKAGLYQEIPVREQRDMDLLNVLAMNSIMRMALEHFQQKEGGCGYLLNVASSAGLMPAGPYMSQYYASKAYAASLTKGVAQELKEGGSRICVDCLCPGPVDTAFNERAGVRNALKGISAAECVREPLKRIAEYDSCRQSASKLPESKIIIPGSKMKLAVWGSHLLPEKLLIRITGHQQKKKL